ncbi:BTAD domain-containing putative transcriptional regulator [Kitasatospora sp. NPDC096147]|uniref:BTAD domain-containing putative transcriptional regulator n=1 Tax=Kitasatospora sp. NPDC096147 TaxID=3364093 RepID=UPI00381B8C1F
MVRISVLGSLAAERDGEALPLGGRRQRSVLALLVIARGRVVSVDRMVEELWQSAAPAQAVTSLQSYVSNLRRLLEPGRAPRTPARLLVSAAPGYALRLDGAAVDSWRFEHLVAEAATAPPADARHLLAEALGLWQGPAHAEFADEPWARDEVARLDELRLQARESEALVRLRTADAAGAAVAAELLTRDAPLREEGWRLHALALWAAGRQADALAALRRARRVLAEEVGLDPGPALTTLESAVLAGRTELLPGLIHGRLPLREPAPDGTPPSGAATAGHPAPDGTPQPATPPAPSELPSRTTAFTGTATARHPAPDGTPQPAAPPHLPTPPTPPELPSGTTAFTGPTGPAPFVGRATELAQLTEAATQVTTGRGPAFALVTGEAGLGKSALLGRLAERLAADGWSVVTGRAEDSAGTPPAWPWVQALRELARTTPPSPGEAGVLAPLLVDDPNAPDASALPAGSDDGAAARFRLHRTVRRWLAGAASADRPVAVLLDDLHWADAESTALLGAAADLLPGAHLLVVGAYRAEEAPPGLAEALARLARREPLRLPLTGLTPSAVAELLRSLAEGEGPALGPDAVATLTERTGGNPFHLRESARLLAATGVTAALSEVPDGVRDVMRRRFARLPEPAVAVLRLAALMGTESEVELLAEAAEGDEDGVLAALEAGVLAGLLEEPTPGRVRFVHALVRETLLADLTGLRARRMHGRIAAGLKRLGSTDVTALAHHFAAASSAATAPQAVHYGLLAAELAGRRYAHDTAATLLVTTLAAAERIPDASPADRIELLGRLLRAQVRAGAVSEARATRRQAVDTALGDPALLTTALTAWTVPTPWQIRPYGELDHPLIALLERQLTRPELTGPERCELLLALCAELSDLRHRRARSAAEQALALSTPDPARHCRALAALLRELDADREREVLTARAAELASLATAHDLPGLRWFGLFSGASAQLSAAAADPLLDEAMTVAEAYRLPQALMVGRTALAVRAVLAERYEEAERLYAEAAAGMAAQGSPHAEGFHLIALATIRTRQQRLPELLPQLRLLAAHFAPAADLLTAALCAAGQTTEARALLDRAGPVPTDFFHTLYATYRATTALALGDRPHAEAVYAALLPSAAAPPPTAGYTVALRPVAATLADLADFLGNAGAAAAHRAAAAEITARWRP